MGLRRSLIISLMILTILSSNRLVSINGQLSSSFYAFSFPLAEPLVLRIVTTHYLINRSIASWLLKLQFSDCFVEGCDGSVLISGPGTERTADANMNLRGFDVIDKIKGQLEARCPGVVSCADILALATRAAVVLSGGPNWFLRFGRRDGRVSLASNVLKLPSQDTLIDNQIRNFAKWGLTTQDYVALVGGHTIGTASCKFIGDGSCPNGGSSREALDKGSEFNFDNSIFRNILNKSAVLSTDQNLLSNSKTSPFVRQFASIGFNTEFGTAMFRMSEIGVITGANGEVRRTCSAINN